MPIILVGAVVLFVFAEPICIVLFGGEYAATGNILRYLIPIMVVILPTYVLCFPVMVPLGLARHANLSNVIGMCVQIVGLVSLALMHQLNVYSLCLLSSFTEVTVFMYRAMIVFLNRSKLKASE
jgi:PST family polysaccharide transporter